MGKESLPEEIARLQIAIIFPYLEKSYLKRVNPLEKGIKEILAELCSVEALPEGEQIRLTALSVMADIILDFWLKKDRESRRKYEASKQFVSDNPELNDEIVTIYNAIKQIGFSGYVVDAESEWQQAALQRFDKGSINFKVIQRRDLEEKSLYQFTGGQERRDFVNKLLKIILEDRLGFKIAASIKGGLRKILKG